MPGGVARTSTQALTPATLPYVLKLASLGWREAISTDPGLAAGVNVHAGKIVHPVVAQALGETYVPLA
jgi:alanine dehydrogenase